MKTAYTFGVLRYVHDVVTREFVSVGVVVYAPKTHFLAARCTNHYGRAAKLFGDIDWRAFRRVTAFVEKEINRLGDRLAKDLPLLDAKLEAVLARVLVPDDSAMQFSEPGAGLTADPHKTLTELYERYIGRFEKAEREKRTEDDVWRVFREPLAKRDVVQYLHPKKIVAPNYAYEFEHSWKNSQWHSLEPISFDLTDEQYVVDKAARWLGRMTSLADAPETTKLHVLLGAPRDDKLKQAFTKAQNLLHKMPGHPELHREDEAEDVARWLQSEVAEHADARRGT